MPFLEPWEPVTVGLSRCCLLRLGTAQGRHPAPVLLAYPAPWNLPEGTAVFQVGGHFCLMPGPAFCRHWGNEALLLWFSAACIWLL